MRKMLVAILAGGALVAAGTPALAQTTAKPTLGPYGYGAIKLGMGLKQARGTGKIVRKAGGGAAPCSGWDLKQYPTGKDRVGLYISKKRGVAVIFAQKGIKTPEGIGIGSTMRQVKRAYPRLKTSASGFPYTSVPRNPKAYYAFLASKGKVRQLILALDTQDCVN
ncbi:hypothetical protein ETD86_52620 [Nonomuraea turkmeniaca]|uniref:Uncharacterized protein n=1 Tax=Nonomuraea turkmeniaca TaxID=103838 RepID=A0A5S4EV32_9ACTN|nr:hypothetical protein [Nonomuraea turkmeniaca]TMR06577.1 hypothetical protein ETD86_52620 [Nonomuraea turkmeniaca]